MMFGVGYSEIVLIALVALVFINPEDLPVLSRKLGKLYGELKRAMDELAGMKDEFIRDIEASVAPESRKGDAPTAAEGSGVPPPPAGEGANPKEARKDQDAPSAP